MPKDPGAGEPHSAQEKSTQTTRFDRVSQIPLPLGGKLSGGVQCGGRVGADRTLLQLASQLEKAQPWFERRPSLGR